LIEFVAYMIYLADREYCRMIRVPTRLIFEVGGINRSYLELVALILFFLGLSGIMVVVVDFAIKPRGWVMRGQRYERPRWMNLLAGLVGLLGLLVLLTGMTLRGCPLYGAL
jgi:uncharacterized iron-regulated membrane protein